MSTARSIILSVLLVLTPRVNLRLFSIPDPVDLDCNGTVCRSGPISPRPSMLNTPHTLKKSQSYLITERKLLYRKYSADYICSWDADRATYSWNSANQVATSKGMPNQYALYVEERLLPEIKSRTVRKTMRMYAISWQDHNSARNSQMNAKCQLQGCFLRPWQVRSIFSNNLRLHHHRSSTSFGENNRCGEAGQPC